MDSEIPYGERAKPEVYFRPLLRAKHAFWTAFTIRILGQAAFAAMFLLGIVALWYLMVYLISTLRAELIGFVQSSISSKIGSAR